jgi:stage II sporulation protein AA (anti-sigma F factor antagonist)
MEEKYQLKEGCLTIQMPKELDHHEAGRLKMEADFLIGAYHVRRLVFDFRETEFMDSSGIGVIIGRCKNMNYGGGSVEAEHLNARIEKIFLVSGLNKIIKVNRK